MVRATRERLSQTISKTVNGGNPVGQFVVINDLAQAFNERLGTWSDDLAEAKAVPADFDPAILGGKLVVDTHTARRMLLERLQHEMGNLERILSGTYRAAPSGPRVDHQKQQQKQSPNTGGMN